MKKIFTLIAAVVACLSVNAADYEFDLTSLGSGWESSYDATTKTITYDDGWKGRGWWFGADTPLDLSTYDEIIVEYETAATIGAQIVVEYADGTTKSSTGGANAGATKVSCTLDATGKLGGIKQIYIQSYAAGTLTLKRAYCPEVLKYKDAVALEYDQYGQIESKAFNGYSDNARVTFTYTVEGSADYVGWGIGAIKSIGGSNIEVKSISAKADGECSVSVTLADLKSALNDGPNEWNMYGIVFNLYGQTSQGTTCTATRKSVTIEEVEGFSGDGYQAPTATAISEVSAASAAEKVVKAVKNGKVVIVKNGAEYNVAGQLVK